MTQLYVLLLLVAVRIHSKSIAQINEVNITVSKMVTICYLINHFGM